VGRPDLHTRSNQANERADLLYRSLKTILALDPDVSIFPGHTSTPVPFNQEILTSSLGLVARHLHEWLLSPDIFRSRILSRIPPTPPNYASITDLNVAGELPDGDITELEAGANRCAVN
jgi:glyoxylase-like metal-dependent hydrolase (beta-lactamase superfamily II)